MFAYDNILMITNFEEVSTSAQHDENKVVE
jgi:hypothetical protein